MGWASRQNEEKKQRTVVVIFPNEELRDEYGDFLKRMRALLESTKILVEDGCELDTESPDFMNQIRPHVVKFFLDLMLTYPNPAYLEMDLETLGNVSTITK